MRTLQIVLFALAFAAFLAAAAVAGSDAGDILWRAGIAALGTDIVMMRLWPTVPAPRVG